MRKRPIRLHQYIKHIATYSEIHKVYTKVLNREKKDLTPRTHKPHSTHSKQDCYMTAI